MVTGLPSTRALVVTLPPEEATILVLPLLEGVGV